MDFRLFKRKEDKEGFQMKALRCPRCNIVMRKVVKNDVVIDTCDKCRGMWLDDNEIEKLLDLVKDKNQKELKAKKDIKKKR